MHVRGSASRWRCSPVDDIQEREATTFLLLAAIDHSYNPNRKWACFPDSRAQIHQRLRLGGLFLELEDGSMSALLLVAGALLVGAYVFHHIFVRGKQCTSQARLDGKTVIVTGELRRTGCEAPPKRSMLSA